MYTCPKCGNDVTRHTRTARGTLLSPCGCLVMVYEKAALPKITQTTTPVGRPSLRQYYAAKAMQTLLAIPTWEEDLAAMAKHCFSIADWMIRYEEKEEVEVKTQSH